MASANAIVKMAIIAIPCEYRIEARRVVFKKISVSVPDGVNVGRKIR
jgi:hypothetical protein